MAKKKNKLDMKAIVPLVVGSAVGGLGAAAIDGMLFPTMNPLLRNGIKAAIGILLPVIVKDNMVNSASNAMLGVAAYGLSQQYIPGMTPTVSGIDQSIAGGSYYRSLGNNARIIRTETDRSIAGSKKKDKGVVRTIPT